MSADPAGNGFGAGGGGLSFGAPVDKKVENQKESVDASKGSAGFGGGALNFGGESGKTEVVDKKIDPSISSKSSGSDLTKNFNFYFTVYCSCWHKWLFYFLLDRFLPLS